MSHYFKIAFRTIKKDKVSSIINIAGLAVGITCFIILSLFVLDELSYDRYNVNSDHIYKVNVRSRINGNEQTNSKTTGLLAPVISQKYPEAEYCTKIGYAAGMVFLSGDEIIKESEVYSADTSYFKVFTHTFISGNPNTALHKPYSAVLTKSFAKKLFGSKDALGRTLRTQQGQDYLVTGVIEDVPRNSSYRFNLLVSMSTFGDEGNWTDSWHATFVVLRDGTDPAAFERKLEDIVKINAAPSIERLMGITVNQFFESGNIFRFVLQPLNSVYLYSGEYNIDPNTEWRERHGDIAYVYIFSGAAVFILLLAIINFVNLITAKSEKRAREVGIKKTLGSDRKRLIFQFISEAMFMTVIAVLIAAALTEMLLPLFNSFTLRQLELPVLDWRLIPALLGFILIVGTLAGSYPAFYLSSFRPVLILKTGTTQGRRKSRLRSLLVVLQFSISITFFAATLIVKSQMDFIQNKNLGFRKDHLVVIDNVFFLGQHKKEFMNDIASDPHVLSSTACSRLFGVGIPGDGYLFNKSSGTDPMVCMAVEGDHDFLNTFGIKIKSGRFFSTAFATDSTAVVINETAAKKLNDKNPIGKELVDLDANLKGKRYKIIGIMSDFNFESLHSEIRPLVMHISLPWDIPRTVTVRVFSDNINQTLNNIQAAWNRYVPDERPNFYFVDEQLKLLYETEEKTSIIAAVFTTLAIFIACLGLFGLAAFVTEQRTKEIGIRKTLGASVTEIILMLSKEFALWVVLANLLAWPAAFYLMDTWLDNFAFRTQIEPMIFIASGAAALVIALITVSIHTIKAANMDPVKSIKCE